MKIFKQTVTATAVMTTLSLAAMTAVAAPTHTAYPEVVVKESVLTQPIQPQTIQYRHAVAANALNKLNLTTTQKKKIQQINAQYPQPARVLTEDDRALQSLQQQRHQLLQSKKFDETRARDILSQEGKILLHKQQQRGDFELQRLKRDHAIYQVLTPQQRDQWAKQRVRQHIRW
ncbi:Spy/CpxP family protein refolding chaperone [Neisseriaceae bacterium ESL0693]|nr:Spy/CpxP family protein refolding chaperone [Neisseriaceae bacterium ESL0693]